MEPKGERYYSRKESSLQGMASEQIRLNSSLHWRYAEARNVRSTNSEKVQNAILEAFRT